MRKTTQVLVEDITKWRDAWLHENDPYDGADCVTPFDHYLYGREDEKAVEELRHDVMTLHTEIEQLAATADRVTKLVDALDSIARCGDMFSGAECGRIARSVLNGAEAAS